MIKLISLKIYSDRGYAVNKIGRLGTTLYKFSRTFRLLKPLYYYLFLVGTYLFFISDSLDWRIILLFLPLAFIYHFIHFFGLPFLSEPVAPLPFLPGLQIRRELFTDLQFRIITESLLILLFFAFTYLTGLYSLKITLIPVITLALAVIFRERPVLGPITAGLLAAYTVPGAYLLTGNSFSYKMVVLAIVPFCWWTGQTVLKHLQFLRYEYQRDLVSLPVAYDTKTALWFTRIFHGFAFLFWLAFSQLSGRTYYYLGGICCLALVVYVRHLLITTRSGPEFYRNRVRLNALFVVGYFVLNLFVYLYQI